VSTTAERATARSSEGETMPGTSPELAHRMTELLSSGAGELPMPASGATLTRWRKLAEVAAEDVALAKLFEGHTDAVAVMAELDAPAPPPSTSWAVWAAEPPDARLTLQRTSDGVRLTGRKAWCSGADWVSHALVTAWDDDNRQCLAAVDVAQPSVTVTGDGWRAVGMGRVASGDVIFDRTPASEVGGPGEYTSRPGFWQGGCGVAACWYGGALPFADAVAALVARRNDPHASAHLGAIDVALQSVRALLTQTAGRIDANPTQSAKPHALRVRAAVEEVVATVLARAGRALGAGPLCRDARLARRFADLPVFVRQTHAENDLAELGELLARGAAQAERSVWTL